MRRFTRAISVRKFATVFVVQDSDRKQFEVHLWKAAEPAPRQIGEALRYDEGDVGRVKTLAHGVANRLAAQLQQEATPEQQADPTSSVIVHASEAWAVRELAAMEAERREKEKALAAYLAHEERGRPRELPELSEAEALELDEAARAAAQKL